LVHFKKKNEGLRLNYLNKKIKRWDDYRQSYQQLELKKKKKAGAKGGKPHASEESKFKARSLHCKLEKSQDHPLHSSPSQFYPYFEQTN
jgi:hypothetical protein